MSPREPELPAAFHRWLPLYLLGIAALTLFPFAAPACPTEGWVVRWSPVDFAANLVAFVPIGLALHRSPRSRTLLLAFALSLAIEVSQHWLPRLQDVADLVSNTLGAGVGHALGRAWTARWEGPLFRPVTRKLALIAGTPVLLVAVWIESSSLAVNDFSNWHPYPLVIGNTAYGDRPWMGEVSDLAIFDRALEAGETVGSEADPDAPVLWAEGGPILWLRFQRETAQGRIDGPGGPVRYSVAVADDDASDAASGGLLLVPSGLILDPWVSNHVVERLREAGRLTLDVHLRSSVLYQHGPARIVSLGDGGRLRDLMLGQQSSGLRARIRTPANGPAGLDSEVETKNGVVTLEPQSVRLTYDGAHAILRVDGKCEAAKHLALANAHAMLGPFLGVTVVVGTAWPGLAAASLARSRRRRVFLAAAGSAAAWILLRGMGAWDHLATFPPAAMLLGVLAFVALLPMLRRPR